MNKTENRGSKPLPQELLTSLILVGRDYMQNPSCVTCKHYRKAGELGIKELTEGAGMCNIEYQFRGTQKPYTKKLHCSSARIATAKHFCGKSARFYENSLKSGIPETNEAN